MHFLSTHAAALPKAAPAAAPTNAPLVISLVSGFVAIGVNAVIRAPAAPKMTVPVAMQMVVRRQTFKGE